jgi:sec-independent protein translocase protein TatC
MLAQRKKKKKNSSTDLKKFTLEEHLCELRARFIKIILGIICTITLIFPFRWNIINFLAQPLLSLKSGENNFDFIYTKLTEALVTEFRVVIIFGIILSFPVTLYQTYMFLAPGLYREENRVLLRYMILSPLLFLLGMLSVYYFIIPVSWRFFLNVQTANQSLHLRLAARVSEYVELVTNLLLTFGLAFQLPIATHLLVKFNVFSVESLCRSRRYVIVSLFILAAAMTPPDVISQILLALPLILLYEVSIFFCKREKNA